MQFVMGYLTLIDGGKYDFIRTCFWVFTIHIQPELYFLFAYAILRPYQNFYLALAQVRQKRPKVSSDSVYYVSKS